MLTVDQFRERATALWNSQKRMAAPKVWKSGRRRGTTRRAAIPIEFTKEEFGRWLWAKVGLNSIPCPHCGAPIDILNAEPDHKTPRSAGGHFALSNMELVCHDCNTQKGDLTREAFVSLLAFVRTLSPHDQLALQKRLRAAHHGSPSRFFRDKDKPDSRPTPAPSRRAAQPQRNIDFF